MKAPEPYNPHRKFTQEVKKELDEFLLQAAETDKAISGLTSIKTLIEKMKHENALAEAAGQPLPYDPANVDYSSRHPRAAWNKRKNLKDSLNWGPYRRLWGKICECLHKEVDHAIKVAEHCQRLSGYTPPIVEKAEARLATLERMEWIDQFPHDPRVYLESYVDL